MRCFLAVPISEEVRDRIVELQHSLPGGLKLVEPENLHLTCKFLGDVSEEKVQDIKKALALEGPFGLTLKGIGVFPNPNYVRVIWVGAEDPEKYVELQKTIDEQLHEIGSKKERDYVPHLTLARVRRKLDELDFLEKNRDTVFGTVQVDHVDLMESRLGPGGPTYTKLTEFRLV